jgi:hypothetical protein
MEEVKINVKNLTLGLLLMLVCIYLGFTAMIPHQAEVVTAAVNLPLQIAGSKQPVSDVTVAEAIQNNQAAINSMQSVTDVGELIVTLCKIMVIVCVASIVFMLLNFTGLVPRFGGES